MQATIRLEAIILSMGFFYGGLAQVIAGIEEWKKGNTFGATAFTSYGLFWLSLVGIVLLPKLGDNFKGLALTPTDFAAYLFMWGIFTLYMFIGTLKATRALQVVFLTLTILFFLLAAGNYLGNRVQYSRSLVMKESSQGFQQFTLPWVRY